MLKFKSKNEYVLENKYLCTLGESDYQDDDFDDCLAVMVSELGNDSEPKYFIIPEMAEQDLYLENYEVLGISNYKITFLVSLIHEVYDHSNEIVLPRCEVTFELDCKNRKIFLIDVYADNSRHQQAYLIDDDFDMMDVEFITEEQLAIVKDFYTEFIETYSPVSDDLEN